MPTTRSNSNSASNTPTRPTTRRSKATATSGTGAATPTRAGAGNRSNSSTPRKAPHCSQCGQPKLGHPRSGCPTARNGDDDANDSGTGSGTESVTSEEVDEATQALGSMVLDATPNADSKSKGNTQTPTRRGRRSLGGQANTRRQVKFEMEDTKQAIRERRKEERAREAAAEIVSVESLSSIASSESEVLNLLGFNEQEDKGKKLRLSRTMPGTMIRPFDSFVSTVAIEEMREETKKETVEDTDVPEEVEEEVATRPLGRTLSVQERATFMGELETMSSERTRLYVLTDQDLLQVQRKTPKRGTYTKLVDFGKDKKLMIVGRDGKEVDELYEKVSKRKGSGFGTGLMVGAAATFGGLAFA
ncbi:hypothetical protein D9758_004147 [Tetrapyrgos nigripes]|uniref:Uncharacterized protein n=1 Tax=Tetrapyrgos nigripes TaxID=182062 RepID=A0A8H5GUR4_9AGAR|nr:hypothetical protein D9758_004147 [Tetrapyrgos nigripes]